MKEPYSNSHCPISIKCKNLFNLKEKIVQTERESRKGTAYAEKCTNAILKQIYCFQGKIYLSNRNYHNFINKNFEKHFQLSLECYFSLYVLLGLLIYYVSRSSILKKRDNRVF